MTYSDYLLQPIVCSRYSRVNAVCEPVVALLHRLDHCGCVHTCPGLKGVLAEYRVVARQSNFDVFVRLTHVIV